MTIPRITRTATVRPSTQITTSSSAKTVVRRVRPAEVTPTAEKVREAVNQATQVRRVRKAEPAPALIEALDLLAEVPTSSRTDYDRIIDDYKSKATTPKRAIRAFCVTCMGGMIAEIGRCTSTGCPLYPFRLGQNPYHKLSKLNPESGAPEDD
jgi:hypothetical protein